MLKEFQPALSRGGDMAMDFLAQAEHVKALEDAGEVSHARVIGQRHAAWF